MIHICKSQYDNLFFKEVKMNINWKLRIKNKTTLICLISVVLSFIYNVLGMFEIVPPVSQEMVYNLSLSLIQILAAIGVVIDPTTQGVTDSTKALNYEELK
jgi:phi LC3 family holin